MSGLKKVTLFIFSISFSICQINEPTNILAKVDDRIITLQDFIRRAEYSIRPDYCRQANYIHKKIILNSLIAEKLLALEAEKIKVDLLDNPLYQSFIRGRSEQAMRQLHYYEHFYDKVETDSSDLVNAYKLAGRTVDITFLNLPDQESAFAIKHQAQEGISLDSAYTLIWGRQSPPKRNVSWFDKESMILHKAVFSGTVTKGSIIGPLTTEENTFLLIQINGWIDRPAITESDISVRMSDVQKRLREYSAEQNYRQWVQHIMTGKQLELNPDIFPAYAEKVTDIYLKSDSVKQVQYGKVLWDDPELDFVRDSLASPPLEAMAETDILFHLDSEPWTIKQFHQEIRKHPLVFRKKKMNRREFSSQLRFAIADLVRDIEITNNCYEKKYDRSPTVKRNKELWSDSSISRYYRNMLFTKIGAEYDHPEIMAIKMKPLVDSLQVLYSDRIEIDTDLFETIELTNIDMSVMQYGVPYPKVVPPFPILTNDDRLDYGRKKEHKNDI